MSNEPSIFELAIMAPHRIVLPTGATACDAKEAVAIFCDGLDELGRSSGSFNDFTGLILPYKKIWVEYRYNTNYVFACLLEDFGGDAGRYRVINGSCFNRDLRGFAIGPISRVQMRTDAQGNVISFKDGSEFTMGVMIAPQFRDGGRLHAKAEQVTSVIVRDSLYAVSLMNCKNVEIVDAGTTTDGLSNKQIRGGGRFSVKYKVLKVTVGKTRQYVLGKVGSGEHVNVPVHLVRGHFAEYTPERPMFGRNGSHGKFWIPAHARGTIENGIVVKDYEVTT